MKKSILLTLWSVFLLSWILFCNISVAITLDEKLDSLTNEDKIALMLMPSFRKPSNGNINNNNIKEILLSHEYAGVILFAENTPNIETTMRFIDMLQDANKNNDTRLLIAIDQEGGRVARLEIWTNMPGNMALAATNNPQYAYEAGKIIGKELRLLGINTDLAPVVDVNSNPSNPVIGIRSFSDDPEIVSVYAEQFINWLHSEGIATSLKHFPGHGDTSTDTHTNLSIVEKTYDELKNTELKPFQDLIDDTEMIMTAHIQYPNIDTEAYVSKNDWDIYTVPATLSKRMLTDILRNDMGYNWLIITDALDMATISKQFEKVDASIRAINAWVDILLMPFTYDYNKDELNTYIETLASKIGTEINEENVNASVKRILKLKEEKWLFDAYDNSDLEQSIITAKNIISSKENHNEEFEIAKNAVTLIKNDGNVLPLNSDDKTVILYEYSAHIKSVNNAISILKKDGNIINEKNIVLYPISDSNWNIALEKIKKQISGAKNVIIIHSLYNSSDLSDSKFDWLNGLINYAHEQGSKVVAMSTQLPYDVVKFKNADAVVLTYFANWIGFNIDNYEQELPKYWPNVIAGIYQLFSKNSNMNGVLPVDIYGLDSNNNFTNEIVYKRGFWLKYPESNEEKLSLNNTEFEQAYEFAFENKITTMKSIQEADMWSSLTRIAMAKMLSQYAINVLGKVPANTIVPKFSDVTVELDDDYDWWVTLAYQLGIMWIWITDFRPYDEVTRAEFSTALSRLLFWTKDWTDIYYSSHLAKLMEEWIITNDNPDLLELRWYVMIMLMRSINNEDN